MTDTPPLYRERRANPRFRVERLVQGSLALRRKASVANLSMSGVALEFPRRLDPGRLHALRLLNVHGREIELGARVVWCHLTGAMRDSPPDPTFRAGLEFEDVLTPEARKLQILLESRADMTFDQRVFGRFSLAGDRDCEIETIYDFEVRTVSAGGMCLETEAQPEEGDIVPLEISLPAQIVRLEGRVTYVTPPNRVRERHGLREVGIAYTQLPLDDFDPLIELLEHGALEADPRTEAPSTLAAEPVAANTPRFSGEPKGERIT